VKLKVAPVLNLAPCHEDVYDSGGMAPYVLNLGNRRSWVVNLTPGMEPLLPMG